MGNSLRKERILVYGGASIPNGTKGQNRTLVFFGTYQNLTGILDELYGFGESTGCNSPIL
jgi:hypothetical protein